MGSDSLLNFHRWYKWKEIAEICKIVVFPRTGCTKKTLLSEAIKTLGREKIQFIRSKSINISSSKNKKNYLKYKN